MKSLRPVSVKLDESGRSPRIAMISVRADHGGGPAHMLLLTKELSGEFEIFAAIPNEPPYRDRFSAQLGQDHIIDLPHRTFSPMALYRLVRWIISRRIDLIHSHGKGAGLYGRLASILTGKPSVHTFHGVHTGSYNSIAKTTYLILERLMSRVTQAIIAVSQSERDQMLQLQLAPENRIEVVENGIEIPRESDTPLANTSLPLRIVTITRFDRAKNPELLAEIINRLGGLGRDERFHFDIIGDGKERAGFESNISSHISNGFVTMHGFLDDPMPILSAAGVYLSTSRWESFGLAVAEGLVRGVPAVATDVTGSRDLVEDGINGFLFPLDDAKKAVEILERLATDPDLRARLAWEAVRRGRLRFSLKIMGQKTGGIYGRILSGPPKPTNGVDN